MIINIKRGLLRLWIVISLCWIVIALLLFLNDTKEEIEKLADYQLFEKSYSLATDLELGTLSDDKKELNKEAIKRKLIPEIEFLGINSLGFKPINIQKEDINKMYVRVRYLDKIKDFSPNTTIQNIWQAYKPEIDKKRNNALMKFGTIVLIPPVSLFIFGLMIFWIIRGFFHNEQEKNT